MEKGTNGVHKAKVVEKARRFGMEATPIWEQLAAREWTGVLVDVTEELGACTFEGKAAGSRIKRGCGVPCVLGWGDGGPDADDWVSLEG